MISTFDLVEIMSMHIATAVTLCLGFIAAFYIISNTMDNIYTDKWWVKINILPDLKIMYRLMLLAPNVIFFWWLFDRQVDGWWYLTLFLTIPATDFILRTIIKISVLILLTMVRVIIGCNHFIDKIQKN